MTDRKKPGVAFWATVVAAVLAAYPLSYGLVGWFEYRLLIPRSVVEVIYAPLNPVLEVTPEAIAAPYRTFNTWCLMRFPNTLMDKRNVMNKGEIFIPPPIDDDLLPPADGRETGKKFADRSTTHRCMHLDDRELADAQEPVE